MITLFAIVGMGLSALMVLGVICLAWSEIRLEYLDSAYWKYMYKAVEGRVRELEAELEDALAEKTAQQESAKQPPNCS